MGLTEVLRRDHSRPASLFDPLDHPCGARSAHARKTDRVETSVNHDLSRLMKEALKLPSEARGALASRLIDSLDPKTDADAEAAWDAELSRREQELDSGQVKAVPWTEARQMILRARRP